MNRAEKVVYTDKCGASRLMLVVGDIEPELGVPLLNLDSLELPEEIEARLRMELWSFGIREYADALQPGANERIAMALRGALKLAVSNIVSLCQAEYKLLIGG